MMNIKCAIALFLLLSCATASAQESPLITRLPPPDTSGGKPLMMALSERRSTRDFSTRAIPAQTLSNLLWAACGVNRTDGHRTAPSARNWQEIDLYLATSDGVYLYDAKANALKRVMDRDVRMATGAQGFVATAPLNLVYVADMKKVGASSSDDPTLFLGADCGAIVQNVYLCCASEGLVTVVRGMVDRPGLAKILGLGADRRILLCQTVGFPKE